MGECSALLLVSICSIWHAGLLSEPPLWHSTRDKTINCYARRHFPSSAPFICGLSCHSCHMHMSLSYPQRCLPRLCTAASSRLSNLNHLLQDFAVSEHRLGERHHGLTKRTGDCAPFISLHLCITSSMLRVWTEFCDINIKAADAHE